MSISDDEWKFVSPPLQNLRPTIIHSSRQHEAVPPHLHTSRVATLACSRSRWGREASRVGKLPLAFSSGRAGKNGRTAVAQSNPYPTETVSALKITCQSGLHIFNPCHRSLVHFTFVLGFSRSGFLVFNFWRMVMAKMSITV